MSEVSPEINALRHKVYTQMLEQIKHGQPKNFNVPEDIARPAWHTDMFAKYGKKIVPSVIIFTSAVMLFMNLGQPAEKKEIIKEQPKPKVNETQMPEAPLRAAAVSDIDSLTKASENHYKTADMDKIADKLYVRYKIEKGLRAYNENLTAKELSDLSSAIIKASDKFDLPPELITGIVITESRGRRTSKSWAGAYGPMQVMYSIHGSTLKKFGVHKAEDLYDTEKGILSGSWIFKGYLERSGNNVKRALARYYGANDPRYYNGTLKRASVVKSVKVPKSVQNPNDLFAALGLDQEKTDRFYRMIYANSLGDGMTLKEAAAWLSADSPELSDQEKARTLALLRYFGNGEKDNVLKFPDSMTAIAERYIQKIGEEEYLEEMGEDLLQAHAIATTHKAGHDLFIECALKVQDRLDEGKTEKLQLKQVKRPKMNYYELV